MKQKDIVEALKRNLSIKNLFISLSKKPWNYTIAVHSR